MIKIPDFSTMIHSMYSIKSLIFLFLFLSEINLMLTEQMAILIHSVRAEINQSSSFNNEH